MSVIVSFTAAGMDAFRPFAPSVMTREPDDTHRAAAQYEKVRIREAEEARRRSSGYPARAPRACPVMVTESDPTVWRDRDCKH